MWEKEEYSFFLLKEWIFISRGGWGDEERLFIQCRFSDTNEVCDYCKRVSLINQYTFSTHYDDFIWPDSAPSLCLCLSIKWDLQNIKEWQTFHHLHSKVAKSLDERMQLIRSNEIVYFFSCARTNQSTQSISSFIPSIYPNHPFILSIYSFIHLSFSAKVSQDEWWCWASFSSKQRK